MFVNRVPRRIFGPKRKEMAGDWRRLHNERHNLYVSPNIIRVTRKRSWREACSMHRRDEFGQNFGRETEGKRPLGRLGHRLEDNIRMNLREIWCEILYWIYIAKDRDQWRTLVNTVMNLRIP
jgi:hypothetical protein